MKRVLFVITLGLHWPAFAALAPIYQNPWDLAVMVEFVKQRPLVMESLRSIDFENKAVHYGRDGKDCKAQFGRKPAPPGPPTAGPVTALEFVSSNCPIGERRIPPAGQGK